MEASDQTRNNGNSIGSSTPVWPTVDGPLGLSEEESLSYARRFYMFGFALLPLLWAVNCFYFWPVLRYSRSFPRIRRLDVKLLTSVDTRWIMVSSHFVVADVLGSAVGLAIFSVLLSSWALTFTIGGEHFFGPVWDKLVMYNLADTLGLTGWS